MSMIFTNLLIQIIIDYKIILVWCIIIYGRIIYIYNLIFNCFLINPVTHIDI